MADNESAGALIAWPMERIARLIRAREHEGGLNPAQWEALRYLAKANRYSNSPGALARYLGATKGTISQSVKALERKGLVSKAARIGEGRSVSLMLTPAGVTALAGDPWNDVIAAAGELGGKTKRRLVKGLRSLLEGELKRGGHASFGVCSTCRYFRELGRDGDEQGPHQCMLFEEALSASDAEKICSAHEWD